MNPKIVTPKFQEAVSRYIDYQTATGRRNGSYRHLVIFWLPRFKDRILPEITTEEIEDALNEAYRQNRWTPATRNCILFQLSGLFRFAMLRRWVLLHPISGRIPILAVDNARTRWLRPQEIRAIQEHCPAWLRVIVEFACKTGMRLREIGSLRVKDYQVDSQGQAYIMTGRTKNGSRLVWPLEGKVRILVEERVFMYRDPDARLFPGPEGGEAVTSIKRHLEAAVVAAGLTWGPTKDGITFHTFRHSMASLALNNGIPFSTVQKMGNWKTPAMVLRYAHLADEVMRDAAGKLDSLF